MPPVRQAAEADRQHDRGAERGCGKQQEHPAPGDVFAEGAAHRPRHHQREGHAGEKAAEHRLAVLIGHGVTDIGEADGDQPRARGAGQHPAEREHLEVRRHRAAERRDGVAEERAQHHPQLAEAVPHRPEQDLVEAVGQREGGDHHRHFGDRARGNRTRRRKAAGRSPARRPRRGSPPRRAGQSGGRPAARSHRT